MTEQSRQPPRAAGAKAAKAGLRAGGSRTEAHAAPGRYLIAAVPPADIRALVTQLEQDEACRLVRVLRGPSGGPGVAVAEMTPDHAALLACSPGVYAEPDLAAAAARHWAPVTTRQLQIEVSDDGGRPVEGAALLLRDPAGNVLASAVTDADGRAGIVAASAVLADAEFAEIRPARGCWPVRVRRPLAAAGPVRVSCTRVTTGYPGFPERALESWGARVMGFGRLPPTYRGSAARIALIGSGAASGHPDLSGQLEYGRDMLSQDEKSWQEDLTGTGTHHAALIAGRDDGTGIVGLAPEAQTHICRVTPGGGVADLIEALDYCVEQRIDVAMFDVAIGDAASGGYSALLAAKVEEAARGGVACVAAAGGFPAGLPHVLTVGAIGQLGTFPPSATDTADLTGPVSLEGLFVPRFSPPGADCCAPGVAIVSGLPPSSYGPLSGTGTAAAHVTALAALILAHHPLFRPEPGRSQLSRDAGRPARLAEVIRASCRPLPQLGPARTGAGVPDVAVALGVAPWGAYPPLAIPYPAPEPGQDGRVSLEPLTEAMHAAGLLPV